MIITITQCTKQIKLCDGELINDETSRKLECHTDRKFVKSK